MSAMFTLARGPGLDSRAAAWSATAPWRCSACTATPARCSRATCSWRCKGERFDANDFLAEAQAKGAVAAIAHRGRLPAGLPGIEVDDSKLALGSLAAGWRAPVRACR